MKKMYLDNVKGSKLMVNFEKGNFRLPAQQFLNLGRQFQSSPILWKNCSIGNTDSWLWFIGLIHDF